MFKRLATFLILAAFGVFIGYYFNLFTPSNNTSDILHTKDRLKGDFIGILVFCVLFVGTRLLQGKSLKTILYKDAYKDNFKVIYSKKDNKNSVPLISTFTGFSIIFLLIVLGIIVFLALLLQSCTHTTCFNIDVPTVVNSKNVDYDTGKVDLISQ
jgi:hypothetical protein